MLISEVIEAVKRLCKGYGTIDDITTRDHVLYGDVTRECTGVVTTIYPSVEVIRKAHQLGANLIISHEACFWNHGDLTAWLADNKTFQLKKQLLDETGITVWRCHDYIHSDVQVDGEWVDGIFYGLETELGWQQYVVGSRERPMMYQIPRVPTRQLAQELMEKMNLQGLKCMGNLDGYSERVMIPMHIIGEADNRMLKLISDHHIDTILTMEITDFTVGIYMRDGAQLGLPQAVLAAGHFNVEEPGMKWFAGYLTEKLALDVSINFVQAGDSYTMLLRK